MSDPTRGLVYVFTGDGKGKTSAALGAAVRAVCVGKRVAIVQWYKNRQWDVSEFRLPEYFGDKLNIFPMGEGFHIAKDEGRRMKDEGKSSMKIATLKGGGMVVDTASEEEHRRAAQEALHLAKELLSGRRVSANIISRVGRRPQSFNQGSARPGLNEAPSSSLFGSLSVLPDGASVPSKQDRLDAQPLFLLVLDEVINAVNDHLLDLPVLLDLLSLRGPTHLILTGRGAPKKLIEIADLVTEMKNVKHPYEKGKKAVLGLDF